MNLTTLNADAKTKNITLQEVKKQVTQNKLPYALAKIGDPYKKFKGKNMRDCLTMLKNVVRP